MKEKAGEETAEPAPGVFPVRALLHGLMFCEGDLLGRGEPLVNEGHFSQSAFSALNLYL